MILTNYLKNNISPELFRAVTAEIFNGNYKQIYTNGSKTNAGTDTVYLIEFYIKVKFSDNISIYIAEFAELTVIY